MNKEQFIRDFNQSTRGYLQENVELYVGGRRRFALSLFLTAFLSALSLKTPHPAVITTTCLLLWVLYIMTNAKTRFFVTSFSGMKRQIAELVNDLFIRTGVDLRYSNRKSQFIGGRDVRDLKLFNDFGTVTQHNTVTGTIGEIPVDIFNFDVTHSHTEHQTVTLFNGSLYIMPVDVPDTYYLSVMPEEYRRKARVAIDGRDVSRLFRSREQKHNELGITPGFAVHTNSEDVTMKLVSESVAALFQHPLTEEESEMLNPLNVIRSVSGFRELKEQLAKNMAEIGASLEGRRDVQRLEMLIVYNKKAYLFFPFRHKRHDRMYPFDLLTKKVIEPDDLWDDIEDMRRKEWILRTLANNARA